MTPEEARELRDQFEFFEPDGDTVAEALETIANLRYEYAVEVDTPEGRAYALESDEGMIYHIANPAYADWEEDRDDMEEFATRVARDLAATTRVVRRLVSEPEVVS